MDSDGGGVGGYPLSKDLFRVGVGREGVPGAGVDEVMKKGEESEEKARGFDCYRGRVTCATCGSDVAHEMSRTDEPMHWR